MIVGASIISAFSINILLVDGTHYGQHLKANVLWAQQTSDRADIYIEWNNTVWNIVAGNNMNDVTSIGLSLTYNPETTTLENIYASEGELITLSDQAGISSLVLNFSSPRNIIAGEKILSFSKKSDETTTVNLIQTNFTDTSDTQYQLSASGDTW